MDALENASNASFGPAGVTEGQNDKRNPKKIESRE